jgi:hypothetical protein
MKSGFFTKVDSGPRWPPTSSFSVNSTGRRERAESAKSDKLKRQVSHIKISDITIKD